MPAVFDRMMCRPRPWLVAALLLGGWLLPAAVAQQPDKPVGLDVAVVEARLAAAKDSSQLSDAERAEVAASYGKALEALKKADAAAARKQEFVGVKAAQPSRLELVRTQLAVSPDTADPTALPGATLADLEQSLLAAEAAARAAAASLNEADARIQARAKRQPALPQLLAAAHDNATQAAATLAALPTQAGEPETRVARRLELAAERYAWESEVAALEAELSSYDGSQELLSAERDLAQRRALQTPIWIKGWQRIVQEQRQQNAKEAENSAAADVARTENRHPLLEQLAKQNEALAKRRTQLAVRLAAATESSNQANERLAKLQQDFKGVAERVRLIGLTDAMGALLRDRRSSLPDPRNVRRHIHEARDLRSVLQQERFEFDDFRAALVGDALLDSLLADAIPPLGKDSESVARELLDARRELVEELRKDSRSLLDWLVRLDTAEHLLLAASLNYNEFVNQRVLWIRSTTPLWQSNPRELRTAAAWFVSSENWAALMASTWQALFDQIVLVVLAVLFLVALLWGQRRARHAIRSYGQVAIRGTTVNFAPTGWSLLLTLVTALPVPAILFLLGRLLDSGANGIDLAKPLGQGLQSGALLVLGLEFFRQVVRAGGLAEAHFGWNAHALRLIRRDLLCLTPVVTVATVVIGALEHHGDLGWKAALGRPVLMIALACLLLVAWRLLRPRNGIGHLRSAPAEGWSLHVRRLWFVLGTGIPATLLLLALLGYNFTTVHLTQRFTATVAMLAALLVVQDVILRALVIARRKLAKQQAAERRSAAAAARAGGDAAQQGEKPAEEPGIDVSSIAEQTRSLVRSLSLVFLVLAIWAIWVDVLPALGIFQDVSLWQEVTLADALLSAIVLIMTFLAARNIPGVLQLTLLQRLQVHEGERHAITTIARYTIILIGLVYGFSTLGIGWGKLQWLAAGVSVGLGFGMQEIFANFISGLIILFERPVRVGDLVTVGGVDGYVTRIKMRATTIRDFNRKELVIPNKEFITGSIVNWTLSDSITRLIVKVGVAYGSDTHLAREVLLRIASENSNILDKPKPKALFMGFGDSTLEFQLRVFTINVDVWPEVIDGLHHRIDQEFRKAGIEIAFPQRDLHIRSAEPLVELLTRKQAEASDAASDAAS
ncbi:MAG: potassium efflux system protein [Planctomycetota bacterium]